MHSSAAAIQPCSLVHAARTLRSRPSRRRAVVMQAADVSKVTFLGAGGQSITVDCKSDQYILDAGLDAGLELPFTCRGGICGACVAKVVKGKVDQSDVDDISFTLEQSEIDEGMALICMSRALGDVSLETQSDWGYSLGVAEWKGATGQITGGKVEPLMGSSWDEMQPGEEAAAGSGGGGGGATQ